jgi:hypothetical protein
MRLSLSLAALLPCLLAGPVVAHQLAPSPSQVSLLSAPAVHASAITAAEAAEEVEVTGITKSALVVGLNRLTVQHTRSCCPHEICFCLRCPVECIKRGKHHIRIVQPGRDVVIRFKRFNRVAVRGG